MAADLNQFADEIKRLFDATAESRRSDIHLLAEGLVTLNEKVERLNEKVERGFAEARREFDEVKAMIKFSHAELAGRLDAHDHELADLRERVERLERKPS